MKFKILILIVFVGLTSWIFSSNLPRNYVYAQKDTSILTMDVYSPENIKSKTPCLIFVFGGGFFKGSKSEKVNASFCKTMSNSGLVVVAIDYRLGMKGVKVHGIRAIKYLDKSINMAVEDLYSATDFLITHADSLNIDPDKIMISGSSAGAVTVLQADYELANQGAATALLPENFKYAGVISFSGGVLSHEGKPDYKRTPAPTMFFHGKEDRIVYYKYKQFFRLGFFGSDALVKKYKRSGYSYSIMRFNNLGHEISYLPMIYYKKEIYDFIKFCSSNATELLQADITITNSNLPAAEYGKWKLNQLYKH
ncbi:MAG: carboxylesterase family protein [Paludibacter sp.]|nr:carboxylesterase family protein [Paludibacter sp.]